MEDQSVLVIEDNKLNMKLITTHLKIWKYRVIETLDAETGLEIARKHDPDLILMDTQNSRAWTVEPPPVN